MNNNDVYDQEDMLESLSDSENLESFTNSYWSYRVVIKESVDGVESGIYEVYFDSAGNPNGWVPYIFPYGFDEEQLESSITELRDNVEMILSAFENEMYRLVVEEEEEHLEILD